METQQATERVKVPSPEFMGGSFNIVLFAPENGFTIKTNRSLGRREDLDPNFEFPAKGLNTGNRGEVAFQQIQNKEASERGEERNIQPLLSPDFRVKINILNIKKEGDILSFDTKPNTFVAYNDEKHVGLTKPENTLLREQLGTPTAVAMIVLTTEPDGSSKMVVQHRSADNRTYKDMIGASAAGIADHEIYTLNDEKRGHRPGTLKPIDNNYVTRMAEKEMEEEVGIDPEYLEDVTITGLVEDLKKVHYEFALMGKVSISAEQVRQLAIEKKSIKRHAFDFSEEFFVLDATPEAIEKLLTQVKNPIPPTHMGAFLAVGRILKLRRDGTEAAKHWTLQMERKIRQNVEEIDRMVMQATNGEEKGYNPRKTPQQQGLPDIDSELERVGLTEKEGKKVIDEILVFDVDGVLTVPDSRQFDRELMEIIAKRLRSGEPVVLNTGRSISWVQERIIARLYHAHNVVDKKALQNLFVVGEKGGTWLTFDERGLMHEHKDDKISVPQDLQEAVKRTVEERFPKTMFFDRTKRTMVSVEMNEINDRRIEGENSLDNFKKDQIQLVEILTEMIRQRGLQDEFKIDPTTIATDLENIGVGKGFAMQRVVEWLREQGVEAKKYLTFGDSQSDIAMAKQLHDEGKDVEFVYVGEKPLDSNFEFPVTQTRGKFNNGTKEFFASKS